jgi:hypothetical protein
MKAIGFPLLLSVSGVICALLVFAAGELLGSGEHGGGHVPQVCASFFVGLRRPGDTYVHLANGSGAGVTARLELIDESGNARRAESYNLGPYATWNVAVGRPAPETGIKVSSPSPDLRVRAEVVFDDGSEPEQYRAGLCA